MLRALLAFLCLTSPALAAEDAPRLAWIAASEADGVATLDVYASFPQAEGGRYALSIEKRGDGGRSSTVQAGTVNARPGGVARIAHNTHSFAATDRIVVEFTFTAPDGTVRHERVTLGDPQE